MSPMSLQAARQRAEAAAAAAAARQPGGAPAPLPAPKPSAEGAQTSVKPGVALTPGLILPACITGRKCKSGSAFMWRDRVTAMSRTCAECGQYHVLAIISPSSGRRCRHKAVTAAACCAEEAGRGRYSLKAVSSI